MLPFIPNSSWSSWNISVKVWNCVLSLTPSVNILFITFTSVRQPLASDRKVTTHTHSTIKVIYDSVLADKWSKINMSAGIYEFYQSVGADASSGPSASGQPQAPVYAQSVRLHAERIWRKLIIRFFFTQSEISTC